MGFNIFKSTVLLFVLTLISCANASKSKALALDVNVANLINTDTIVSAGANQLKHYLPLLKGKRIGIVANQTSVIFKNQEYTHLVDSLLALKLSVKKVFTPEHGFRGTADAGELVNDSNDNKTGLPLISLHGKNKKPTPNQLKDIDIIVFDIQDVGVRFYTYVSTLHYVMEACAEANIPLIVLDRPNPNGHYIDGPVLNIKNKSFVGMHPVPIVYGMTIGEYAKMINGEKWLKNNVECKLTIIPITHYNRKTAYHLPIKPSPNLPNDKSINLYPSLCFFEGTNVSVGRGTDKQFQIYGSPFIISDTTHYKFTPRPNKGAKHPKHENKICSGFNLSNTPPSNKICLNYLINAYNLTLNKTDFFNKFFIKLSGTKELQKQIKAGLHENEIKKTWKNGLDSFKITRKKYLIYN